ncbi:MAG: GFA family protein [bacterium]
MSDWLTTWFEGGCHCGKVRFKVRIERPEALACNCSICAKKGFINLLTEADNFVLLAGEEHLHAYRFNTHQAEHRFCRTCGIHPFSRPRSHPGSYDINARCLDAGTDFLVVRPFDGRNWEENVGSIV